MEIFAEDKNGRHLFVIFIYQTSGDHINFEFKSNLPEFIFELHTIKPVMKMILSPGLSSAAFNFYSKILIEKIKKVKQIERWYLKDSMLTSTGKLCQSYYFTLENILDAMAAPVGIAFSTSNQPYAFESLLKVIANIKKYNPFYKIARSEFETYINGNFTLQGVYVECYSSSNIFFKLKANMEIDGKGLIYLSSYDNIELILIYESLVE